MRDNNILGASLGRITDRKHDALMRPQGAHQRIACIACITRITRLVEQHHLSMLIGEETMKKESEQKRIDGEVVIRLRANKDERHRLRMAAAILDCSVTDLVRKAAWEAVARVLKEAHHGANPD